VRPQEGDSVTLSSPGYPKRYPNSHNCRCKQLAGLVCTRPLVGGVQVGAAGRRLPVQHRLLRHVHPAILPGSQPAPLHWPHHSHSL
jgi:hypothetical protein